MDKLYALKNMLCEELEKFGDKDKLDMATLESVDKLTHALKNLDKVIEKKEEEQYGYSNANMPMYDNGMNYSNMSYSRGRGSNARRDSMGRYASRSGGGYSNANNYRGDYQELMQDMPGRYDMMPRM